MPRRPFAAPGQSDEIKQLLQARRPPAARHPGRRQRISEIARRAPPQHDGALEHDGTAQRLALARALARDPEILFLDEPTASLDPAATKSMEDLIDDIAAKGIKVVMSTHHLGEARRIAGDIVLMHRGRIVESAPAETFFTTPRTEAARRFVAGELLV